MELQSPGEGSGSLRTDWSMDHGTGLTGKRATFFSQAKETTASTSLDARNRPAESASSIRRFLVGIMPSMSLKGGTS